MQNILLSEPQKACNKVRHISQHELEKIEQRDIKLPTNHNFKTA